MELLRTWLTEGNLLLLGVVSFFVVIIIAQIINSSGNAKKLAEALILEAERQFKSETGQAKFTWVAGRVYEKLPTIIKSFYSKDKIERLVQESFDTIKDTLLKQVQNKNEQEGTCVELSTDNIEVAKVIIEDKNKDAYITEDKYVENPSDGY